MDSKVQKFREDADEEIRRLSCEETAARMAVSSSQENLELYKEEYMRYRQKYEAIRDASFWKITAPLRKAVDIYRCIRTGKKKEKEYESKLPVKRVYAEGKIRIGVHLDLCCEDRIQEFCKYLNCIPEPFDLYITCRKNLDQVSLKAEMKKIPGLNHMIIKETAEQGYGSVGSFYAVFRKELVQYPYLLHFHSMESETESTCRHALDSILKDESMVIKVLELLEEAGAGLVFGEMSSCTSLYELYWPQNDRKSVELLNKLGMRNEGSLQMYPDQGFFWAKGEAVQCLFDSRAFYKMLEENGDAGKSLDQTLGRVTARTVEDQGFDFYLYNPVKDQFSKNKSYGCLKNYFMLDSERLEEQLSRYDLISFDIFDTLITRMVFRPDDLFRLLGIQIKEKYNRDENFLKRRKEAENLARKEKGDFCNINHIYEKLPEVSDFTPEEAQELKQMEIDLEYQLCIPRDDVREVYQNLQKRGKRIILVSDMYLTKDTIAGLLEKCGFTGYEDLWISCEKGKRKDRGNIWPEFFEKYGESKSIHVGDNPYSDCRMLSEYGRDCLLLLSSAEQFRLSRNYERYLPYIDSSVENSLMLGYMINKCLYNSPFSLTEQGCAKIDFPEKLSEGILGPVFLVFSEYIQKTSHEDTQLLFLAREGYFLQKLYQKYCLCFGCKERKNVYFLASRRAAAVAQIENFADAKEVLSGNFSGTMAGVFLERLGLEIHEKNSDELISLPRDMIKVISVLKEYADDLLNKAQDEKKHYMNYIRQALGGEADGDHITVVDLGYAGTIQYYLIKLLKQPMDGCYLMTDYQMKPDKVFGTFRGLYSFWKSRELDDNKLFLEAATAAPHGQVIRFETQNGQETAVLKRENDAYHDHAEILQAPIYHYIEEMGALAVGKKMNFDRELAECILGELFQEGLLSKEMHDMFAVEDGYCSGGEWQFDGRKGKWVLIRK